MGEQRPSGVSGSSSGSGQRSPAQETGMQGRDTAQEVSTQVSDTARQVSAAASEYAEQGREKIGELEQYLEDNIRAKPLQSVLLAAGVGMLIALLWKR